MSNAVSNIGAGSSGVEGLSEYGEFAPGASLRPGELEPGEVQGLAAAERFANPDTDVQKALDGIASELIAQLGMECFTLDVKGPAGEVPAVASGTSQLRQAATIPVVAGSEPKERDFWDDVALLSNGAVALSPNAFGEKPDVVAYAIATVAARYTLASGEAKHGVVIGPPNSPSSAQRSGASPTGAAASGVVAEGKHSGLEECDFATVLESFFEFEQDAALADVEALDSTVFELARQRATSAVVAANVIKNSALKAAEGRRG